MLISKGGKEDLTNKQILKDLEYSIILENKEKLVTHIFAVEGIRITRDFKILLNLLSSYPKNDNLGEASSYARFPCKG